jgi:protein involved in polysaccharide export with SLBB domain
MTNMKRKEVSFLQNGEQYNRSFLGFRLQKQNQGMNIKSIVLLLAIVGLSFTSSQAFSQTDYKNIKVDQLSDAQIKDMMNKAGDMGYSDAQLEQAAAARGMDATEIKKLKERVEKIRLQNNEKTDTEIAVEGGQTNTGRSSAQISKTTNADPEKPQSRVYGSDLFGSGSLTFEPNMRMATPKNYIIGPDDELLIDITGDNEASYKPRVSPEGTISIEYIGRISVAGLTIEQATNKIRSAMSGTYPAMRSGRTQVAVNLGNIRSIKVIITGEVTKPGTYTLSSLASVYNALYASGGPNENGSFRNIQVIRNNRVIATVDVYDFLVNGIQPENIRLQDQDVIHIPIYQIRVDVTGEVKRPAIYEIRADESLADVLKYAGGFSEMAYKARVKVFQNTPTEKKVISKTILEFPDYKPRNGDKVIVDPILDRFENKIQLVGAVFRPGVYELTPGLTLKKLIEQADGLKEDAFMNRGYIIRLNPDNTSAVIPFDVSNIMQNASSDIALKREDIVQVSSIFDLRDEYTVSIGGEVREPGAFNFSTNMRVEDLVQMAGGFKEGASPANIEVARRIKGTDLTQKTAQTAQVFNITVNKDLSLSDTGFILEPFDMVSVRPTEGYTGQQQVQILGEILRPGIYTIQSKNERISDIIKRAGGLTAFAYSKGASLKRPTPVTADAEEESIRSMNLERLRQTGASDSAVKANTYLASVASDLVGIELDKILETPQSRYDLLVENGDVIRIPTLLQTVKVTGEVLRPISVVYKPGKPFKYYVTSAGGFTSNAHKKGSFISNANGAVAGTTKALFFNNYPAVTPGSEISVPQRAIRERMSAQAWVGIGTGIASLAALIFAIIK